MVSIKKIDPRQKLIRLIHVAKRDLQLDEETYRNILIKATGKSSSSDMSIPELEKTLEHLKRCGFKVRHTGKGKAARSRQLADDAQSKKIRALWLFLHDLGLVRNASEAALGAYTKRITGVDALQWLSGKQAETLIESLKKWAMRRLPEKVREMHSQVNMGKVSLSLSEYNLAILEKREPTEGQKRAFALSRALVRIDRFAGFDPMLDAYELLQEIIGSSS